ncbi:MAG: hypothetical protein HY657_09945 [Acidobacteria bacterium]|nr:hypothetical protein [Acidobacteriota bacterium]
MTRPGSTRGIVACLCVVGWTTAASAQNWSFDARKIALGNAAGGDHPASRLIDEDPEYRAIVLPFGLIQVLRNRDVFNPDSGRFDIVRSVEYAAAPLHYIVGRDDTESDVGRRLSVDIRNATLSRDLNTYRGFVPARQPDAEGLAHTTFGGTIPVFRGAGGASHGIYLGVGPYFSMRSSLDIDQQLIDILASETDVYRPNAQFRIGVDSRGQMALAVTGGYHGRFSTGGAGARDGVYVALDYNYLHGFRYEDIDTALRLDTDSAGLLTVNPFAASPLVVGRDHTSSGRGFAIDLGVGVVASGVEVGFGVKGLANRIDWRDVERTTFTLGNLFQGGAFVESAPVPVGDVSVELRRDYRAYAGYRTASGLAVGEFGRGFQGTSFHGGYEHRFGAIDLRGGAFYTRERWQPTGGIGLNMGERVSLDLAMYGTSANVERKRRAAIAVSLRFNQVP